MQQFAFRATLLLSLISIGFSIHLPRPNLRQAHLKKDIASLNALFIVHRHGDRTIISTFPNDKYINASYWPDGWGELTEAGKSRMYNVGRFLRKRYDGFLTDNVREATVRSSGIERCLESTQLVLNGMYNPTGRWVWDANEKWQPFPVHTTFPDQDSMLNPDAYCPAAKEEFKKILASDYVKKLTEQYKKILDHLSAHCGENINDLFAAEYVYDSLKIEQIQGYNWPSWVDNEFFDQLSKISDATFYIEFMTRAAQRFRTGVFLNDFQQRVNTFLNQVQHKKAVPSVYSSFDNDDWKKVFVYSSHDTFVAALLNALGVFNDRAPPFGATVLFELHNVNQSGSAPFIRSFYLNETSTEVLHPLSLPACDFEQDCPVDVFSAGISPLLINDFQKECEIGSNENDLFSNNSLSQSDLESGTYKKRSNH